MPNTPRPRWKEPWKKGQSGNPGGRPKEAKVFAEWLREEKFSQPHERDKLWTRAQKSDFLMVRLLAYAYGNPPQEITGEIQHVVTRIIDVSPDGRQVVRNVERAAMAVPSVAH